MATHSASCSSRIERVRMSRMSRLTTTGAARSLADGNSIPLLGLGVWQVPNGPECVNKVWGYSNPSALPCQATNWSRGTPPSAARRYHQGRLAQRLGKFDELELVADRDRAGDRTVDRAARLVMVEGAGDLFAVGVGVEREREADVDSSDHQHAVLGLDLADRLCGQSSFSGGNLTRLQRASEGAGQSPGGGSDYVVERGRMCRFAAE